MPPAAAGPLLSQTPPSPLAAAARCQRRRHHCSLLALATDADAVTDHWRSPLTTMFLAASREAAPPTRDAQLQPQAGCSDSALRDSEMTQIETWNYFVGTWKRHRGSSELSLKERKYRKLPTLSDSK